MRRRAFDRGSACARRRRSCCTRARSRRTRASTSCSPRWRSSRPSGRTRGCCWPAASRIRCARRRTQAADAGIADVTIFAGEQPAGDIPAYLLAADVLVSPRSRGTNTPLKIYQYLRSGRPIVATRLLTHTQVLSDETAILTGASAGEFAAGILSAINESGRGCRDRAAGPAARRDQVQLPGVSGPDAPRVRAAGGVMSPDHYSYTVYADPQTARTFDDRRFGGPIGELVAETQAAVDRSAWPAKSAAGPSWTSARARAARLSCWPRRRRGHRRRRVRADAGGRRASARVRPAATITFIHRDAHALEFGDRSFDVAVSLRVLMHSPRWREALSELCRVASRRVIFDYPSSRSAARLQSVSRRICRPASAPRPSRIASSRIATSPPRSRQSASGSGNVTGSSCCRSHCTRRSARGSSRRRSRRFWNARGCCVGSARR